MSNQFIALPVPPGDGFGAAVDVSSFGPFKSILVGSMSGPGVVTIEVSEDAGPADFAPIARFDKPGNIENLTLVARFMRVSVVGFNPVLSTPATVTIGAADETPDLPPFVVPVTIAAANAAGIADTLVRGDHVHAHGAQSDPTMHAVATGAANGFMSAADKAKLDTYPAQPPASLLIYGFENIAAAADTRFLGTGSNDGTAPTTSDYAFRMPRSGTLRNFRVRHNSAIGNGNSVVYDIRIDTAPQGLGLTLASGAIGDASDLATTIAVSAGELIEVTAVKALSLGAGGLDVMFAMEYL